MYRAIIAGETHTFPTLADLMAKATPLAAATSSPASPRQRQERRVAAQIALADLPLATLPRRAA